MRKNVRQAMDALFSGKDYTNASIQTRQSGENMRLGVNWPTVYSYGSHFPLIVKVDIGALAYVNQDKYSVTTSNQQSGVSLYLHYEGYRDTGETITHHGHTYAVYRKDEPESWPQFMTNQNSVFARPNHHGARYDGPAYHADTRTYGPREN
jgi:hypothetical protein